MLVSASVVARLLSCSTRMIWNMHQDGTLGVLPVHLGRKTLWPSAELATWVANGCPRRERWQEIRKLYNSGKNR